VSAGERKAAGKGGKSKVKSESQSKSKSRGPDLQAHLMAQPKERLVAWLLGP
jgi:hypothetical protein